MNDEMLEQWQRVPQQVAAGIVEGRRLAAAVYEKTAACDGDPQAGEVFWSPATGEAWAVIGNGDPGRWEQALADSGFTATRVKSSEYPTGDWVRLKRAAWTDYVAPLQWVGRAFRTGGKALGGPHALSTSLIGGLLAGGLGYGAGALAENLFPERFVRRGRLRRALALLGAGLGATPGLFSWYANHRSLADGGYQPRWWQSALIPHEQVPASPGFQGYLEQQRRQMPAMPPTAADVPARDLTTAMKTAAALLSRFPAPCPVMTRAIATFVKFAAFPPAGGVGLRPVPVDAFNQAIWNDVRKGMTAARNPYGAKSPWGDNTQEMHTPPAYGAAASGLVTGVQSLYQGRSVLSPRHFIRGLAAAGTDLATAHVAGGVLGALGGLSPEAQEKLQDMGLWGGFIRGVVSSVFGGP